MHRKARLLGILIGVIVLVVSWVSGLEQDTKPPTCRLANLADLVLYPDTISENELTPDRHLFTACLPGSNLAVILRPITESEYGTFQISEITSHTCLPCGCDRQARCDATKTDVASEFISDVGRSTSPTLRGLFLTEFMYSYKQQAGSPVANLRFPHLELA